MKSKKGEAIRPGVLTIRDFIEKKPVEPEMATLTADEKTLAAGAGQAFWLTLKKHINTQLAQLDRLNEEAVASGMPAEEIGKNTIVITQVKGVMSRIFNVVEDASEAQQNAERK